MKSRKGGVYSRMPVPAKRGDKVRLLNSSSVSSSLRHWMMRLTRLEIRKISSGKKSLHSLALLMLSQKTQ